MWFTQAGWSVRSPERDRGEGKGADSRGERLCGQNQKVALGAANRKRDFKRSGSWLPKVKLIERQNRYLKSMWNNIAFVSRAY